MAETQATPPPDAEPLPGSSPEAGGAIGSPAGTPATSPQKSSPDRPAGAGQIIDVALGVLVRNCMQKNNLHGLRAEEPSGRLTHKHTSPADGDPVAEVLITRRKAESVYGGYWEMPGGKREPDESLKDCVGREMREELGIEVAVGNPLDVIEYVYPHGHVRLHPFYCEHLHGDLRNLEVAEHRWVQPGSLHGYSFPPANAPLIEQVLRDLT